jgi:hypothetical protein
LNIITASNGGRPPLRRGPRRAAVNGPPKRLEAAFARRLDRMARQYERIGWNVDFTNETLVLFVRLWLTHGASARCRSTGDQSHGTQARGRVPALADAEHGAGSRIGSEISQDIAVRAATDRDD